MKSIVAMIPKNLPTFVMLLFAVLSLGVVIESRDPVGLLGWLFCLATILTCGNPVPVACEDSF